jgi:dihydroorotate dehydrogenase (fumarate)
MPWAVLHRQGPDAAGGMRREITDWMVLHEYESVRRMQGSMNHGTCDNPAALERANCMRTLHRYE